MTIQSPLKIKKLSPGAVLPKMASSGAAGFDIASNSEEPISIAAGAWEKIPTGLAFELSPGMEAQVRPRSGLSFKHGVTVLNSPGTIDADYRGEVSVILINHGSVPFVVEYGMRVAQIVVARIAQVFVAECDSLSDTKRGEGGFGHTGLH